MKYPETDVVVVTAGPIRRVRQGVGPRIQSVIETYLLTQDVVYQTQGVGPRAQSVIETCLLTQDVVYQTQGVGPRPGDVQTCPLRSDSDAGQHDVHSDGDER